MALVVKLFSVYSSVASVVYNANLLSLLKREINNLQPLLSVFLYYENYIFYIKLINIF
uniref:Uncharacterized protein n=1 Tax=Cucumis melo TaxID=3656 RepID=A0A9I9EI49_CUCME